jgi:RNA polymerase sigma-70 factor (ECF subfamily)
VQNAIVSAAFIPSDPDATRASLLKRVRDLSDATSWQDFFDTYWGLIYGVARKAGLRDDEAQDVVQETFACVVRQMPNFHYDPALGSFKGWLLRLTRWRIADQFGKRLPVSEGPPAEDETRTSPVGQFIDPQSADMEAVWEADWQQNLLRTAQNNVKSRRDAAAYQLFDCYVNKEWPASRVAETFGVNVSQVYLARHRVMVEIKKEVERLERETV